MKTAEQASDLSLPENSPVKVSAVCDEALDEAVIDAIESGRRQVSITLMASKCSDSREKIIAYLEQNGYKDVSVVSDYPWWNEFYEGSLDIKFSF